MSFRSRKFANFAHFHAFDETGSNRERERDRERERTDR
jgi:hypothetical protein